MPNASPPPGDVNLTRLTLGDAAGKLRQRVKAGRREFIMTVGLSAAPAVLVFAASAIIRVDQAPGGFRASRIWTELTQLAQVFPGSHDPMETAGALAAIAVAIIFYNARAELPDPEGSEASDHDLERTSTILRTKSVLRVVALVIAVGCWMLLIANIIRTGAGARTVVNAVEFIALSTLIMLSCNFVTSQREEIAQRSLLVLDAAVSAYKDARARRAAGSVDRSYRSLKRRSVILAAVLVIWLGFAVVVSPQPLTADFVIILVIVAIVPILLHLAALGFLGALRVPWWRSLPLAGLGLTAVPLLAAYVSVVGLIVAPPVATPDPRDQAFFTATLVLFIVTAIALWPVIDITANRKARKLRAFITARESHIVRDRKDLSGERPDRGR